MKKSTVRQCLGAGLLAGALLLVSCISQEADGDTGDVVASSSTSNVVVVPGSKSSSSQTSSSSVTIKDDAWASLVGGTFERSNGTTVTVGAFKISKHEVTALLYTWFMQTDSSLTGDSISMPITNVSWYDAARFCNVASKSLGYDTLYSYSSVGAGGVLLDLELRTGVSGIRLPTEAEWEFSVRAGTGTDYYWGDAITASVVSTYACYAENCDTSPQKVGLLKPNNYGLYDMAGNVREWMHDWYGNYTAELENPMGVSSGAYKAVRGGGFASDVTKMRSNFRDKEDPEMKAEDLGFRLVLVP